MTAGIAAYPLVDVARGGETLFAARDASTWRRRLRGLQGHPGLELDEALLIRPCRSIQTWHMRHAIDVAFLDGGGRVRRCGRVPPGRTAVCLRAASVIEMAEGAIERFELAVGDLLSIVRGERA